MRKSFIVLIGILGALFAAVAFFRFTGSGTEILWNVSQGGAWMLPLVMVSALIDSINPCAFSVMLLTIAFLFSLGRPRREILAVGGTYIAGLFAVYILIGLGILQALHFFNTPHFMAKVGASLLLVFGGIALINEFFPKFPLKLKIPSVAHGAIAKLMEKASLPTAFLLGMLVGLCEFPCTGGPYLMILGLLHDTAQATAGALYLVLYNLIFVSPLVVLLLIAADKALLEKVQAWKRSNTRSMRLYGSIALLVLGGIMFLL